jgi:hypothetical protein
MTSCTCSQAAAPASSSARAHTNISTILRIAGEQCLQRESTWRRARIVARAPNLNVVDDIRLLRQIAPEIAPFTLWEMITVRGARAVQLQKQIGSITPGMRADLVAFDVRSADPLLEILEAPDLTPKHLWMDGERVY